MSRPPAPLACPACGAAGAPDERFCAGCGLPLVLAPGEGAPPRTDAAADRARKVRPAYAEGPLVRVASARHQAEAELLQDLLLQEGVPSLVRRSGGFDVPDFLASGPRDVLVPASGAEVARALLPVPPRDPAAPAPVLGSRAPVWVRALAMALAVLVIALVAAAVISAVGV
jgi:hypothetical protein